MRRIFCCIFLLLALMAACSCAESRKITFLSRGILVPATLTLPDSTSDLCPIVILAHGHGGTRDEHKGFIAIAEALAQSGIGSIRIDFSGCGESEEDFTANCLSAMKQDMMRAMSFARSKLLAPQVGLFGYSMGGRVVLEMLAEGADADAIALLAPANDLSDLIETSFKDFETMYIAAKENGFYPLTESEHLSPAWFEDLLRYDDPAASAAEAYNGPSLVIWAEDDYVVRPHVSAHVADMLGAETFDATGKGHIYGFWLDEDPLRERIADAVAQFFVRHLLAAEY